MSVVPYFVAAVDAERYLNHEINFKEATDNIVQNIHIYVPLTTAKLICDTIVLSVTGLINYGLEAFKNAIKLSLNHIFTSLRSCSIGLILSQFKHIYDKHEKVLLSISIIDFYLMKYLLECMGIIRAVAESNNIDFVKYMNKCYSDEIYINNTSSSNNEHSFERKRVKDPDFIQIITISLEDIFHGKVCDVIVKREIRDINKQMPEIEEATYQVIIEPGYVDGKTFRFIEAGSNLIYIAKISLQQALDGLPVQIPLIDGRTEEFYPNDIINPHTEFIIDQAGLPDPTNNGIRGRLIVKFDIDFPDYKLGREPVE
ncbi:unnamed protein product [Rotaria sordida]|uniref:Chaperone DnaJ C-terminal domain-containing protein n=1 Tax=Rotaria sordida TaxID=392033 RepID=A0A813VTF1_9BILA|nr:unnamed protein product [Rotaria sordida]CAF0846177.1 unnamed protein product [Rotaria sordida]